MKKLHFVFWVTTLMMLAAGIAGCSSTPLPSVDKLKYDHQPRFAIIAVGQEQIEELVSECLSSRRIALNGREFITGTIHGAPVVIVNSGKSMVNAAVAAQQTADLFTLNGIIVVGLAVAINPALSAGDLVVPKRWAQPGEMLLAHQRGENYWDIDTNSANFFNDAAHFGMMFPRAVELTRNGKNESRYWFDCDPSMLKTVASVSAAIQLDPMENLVNRPPVIVSGGNGVSSQGEVDNPEYRDWLWQTFKADIADTETAAIAQVATVNRLPFLACRVVTDIAGGEHNQNDNKICALARRNAADFIIMFLNNHTHDTTPAIFPGQ